MLSPEAPRSRGNRSDASFCAARGEHGKPRTGNRCGKRRGTPTHDCPTWRSALVRLRGRSGVMCGAQTNCVPGVAERVILWLAAELSFAGSPRADAPPGFPRQPVDSQTRRKMPATIPVVVHSATFHGFNPSIARAGLSRSPIGLCSQVTPSPLGIATSRPAERQHQADLRTRPMSPDSGDVRRSTHQSHGLLLLHGPQSRRGAWMRSRVHAD